MNEPFIPRSPDLSALHASASRPDASQFHPPRGHYGQQRPQYPLQPNPGAFQYNPSPAPPLQNQYLDASSYQSQPVSNFAHPPSNGHYQSSWPAQPPQHYPYGQQPPLQHEQSFPSYAMPRATRRNPADPDYTPQNDYAPQQQLYNGQPTATPESDPVKPPPGEQEGIVVKTKFPVARIKRIVQADEDVGKVAQSTPVAVSKALELFMISLALGSADVARQRGSKKITGAHLKALVDKGGQFDFLSDIVSKIQDGGASANKKGRDASESEDRVDDDSDEEYGAKRRKTARAAKTKKKKVDSSDED